MADDDCIHLPRQREEHDAKHKTPKASCGWCCYLREKARADRMLEMLRHLEWEGDEARWRCPMCGGGTAGHKEPCPLDALLRSEQAKDDGSPR